jgi:hypothetical protein
MSRVHQTLISVIVFYGGTLLMVHQTLISVIVFYSGTLLMVYQRCTMSRVPP